ncbi:glutamate-1-semialdehyde 2,1-aminomutase [Aquella oligotrophica]|uniref:Glutamate-1-semialdehyde 2,1-aminomutase n=1 Tax=Aquella oligotrophica TaxID=2067065 RepID=A0A2I7N9S0_9NEIS|nr:glutamate-1-semialdehyde 2,1-aminomutase [Aquella oligotrophica]AUR53207.1 glutamate-1-semialdehyde-2,1-aminomutase [Aquella oligotrophica]
MLTNKELFEQAKLCIPGGVNSPVRSFNSVGGTPFFTARAEGSSLFDIEGKEYIDYVCSWGANIVGHANKTVIARVTEALANGFSYGTPTELEVVFAKKICELVPSIDKFRLVSSGTEAVMSAIRLARGYTRRNYIIKFNGCYHGHSDSLLIKAGSGLQTFGNPSSSGVPEEAVRHTLVLEYNDTEQLVEAFRVYPEAIAAVVIEPFAGNMNLVRPTSEFIQQLRELCTKNGTVLVFDEVMTGFRVALGGAQQLLGIKPDLTTVGKVIGGGMPLAGFGGKAEIMDCLAPIGGVYQAGTLSGNPVAVTAGLAVLDLIQQQDFYLRLANSASLLMDGLKKIANEEGISLSVDSVGGMFGFYFSDRVPQSFAEVKEGNQELFNRFFHLMLDRGVFFAPSMYEAGFISAVHDSRVIDKTLAIARDVFKILYTQTV